jgi:hypothetical protein
MKSATLLAGLLFLGHPAFGLPSNGISISLEQISQRYCRGDEDVGELLLTGKIK